MISKIWHGYTVILFSILLVMGRLWVSPVFGQEGCPEQIGHLPYGPTHAVAMSGSHTYIGVGEALRIVDISNPETPQLVGAIVLPNVVERIAVAVGYAYIADANHGLAIIDVSTPSLPVKVGDCYTGGFSRDVAVSGSYAFPDGNSLRRCFPIISQLISNFRGLNLLVFQGQNHSQAGQRSARCIGGSDGDWR